MPGLTFKGNLIEMFGDYLPTPFIDKITIQDDHIAFKLAIYFETPTKLETSSNGAPVVGPPVYEELKSADGLKIWVVQSADKKLIEKIIAKEINIVEVALPQTNYIFIPQYEALVDETYVSPSLGISWAPGYEVWNFRRMRSYDLQDFHYEDDYPNEEMTRRIYKYSLTDTTGVDNTLTGILPLTFDQPEEAIALKDSYDEVFSLLPENFQSLSLFTFSSTWDPTLYNQDAPVHWHERGFANTGFTTTQLLEAEATLQAAGESTAGSEGEPMTEWSVPPPQATWVPPIPDNLLENQISNISYEHVFDGGDVVSPTIAPFVTPDGTPYNKIPMRGLAGQYYTVHYMNNELLSADIKSLLSEFTGLYASVENLRNMMDTITITLNTKNEGSELLRELYKLRPSFTSQTATDPLGMLFERFTTRLYRADRILRQGQVVVRRVLSNPKIFDARDGVVQEYDPSTFGGAVVEQIQNDALYQDIIFSRQVYNTDELDVYGNADADVLYWGHYFVDIEKIIHSKTLLSQVYDTVRLEQYFGKALTNATVAPVAARLRRARDRADVWSSPVMTLECIFDTSAGYPTPLYSEYICDETYSTDTVWTKWHAMNVTGDATAFSHLAPRAFNIATKTGLGEYRLLCMAFEDYRGCSIIGGEIEEIETHWPLLFADEYYQLEFDYKDYSPTVVAEIMANFQEAIDYFNQYAITAADACNYDAREDVEVFNQFFIDGMIRTFNDDMDNAPWLRAPALYFMHLDLLTGEFGGDVSLVLTKAQEVSQQLSPTTGNLPAIQDFVNTMRSLYAEYYDPDTYGTIGANVANWNEDVAVTLTQDEFDMPPLYVAPGVEEAMEEYLASPQAAEWNLNEGSPKIVDKHDKDGKDFTLTWTFIEEGHIKGPRDDIPASAMIHTWNSTLWEGLSDRDPIYIQWGSGNDYFSVYAFQELVKTLIDIARRGGDSATYGGDGDMTTNQKENWWKRILSPKCLSRGIYWDRRSTRKNGYGNMLDTLKGNKKEAFNEAGRFLGRMLWPNQQLIVDQFNLKDKYSGALARARRVYKDDQRGPSLLVDGQGNFDGDWHGWSDNAFLVATWVADLAGAGSDYFTESVMGECKCDFEENRNYRD